MISAQSQRSRRVVGRLDRGSSLIQGIIDLCSASQVRSGEFRASGWLEDVELHEYDAPGRRLRSRSLSTPVQLLSLTGTIAEQEGALSVSAHAVLSRPSDNGIQVLGGLLASARVFQVEIVIDAFDDLLLRRALDAQTGLPAWTEVLSEAQGPPGEREDRPAAQQAEPRGDVPVPQAVKEARLLALKEAHLKGGAPLPPPRPEEFPPAKASPPAPARAPEPTTAAPSAPASAPPPAPPAGPAAGWDTVKAASEAQAEASEDAEVIPQRGDLVEHATFGRCTIERVEDAQERVSVRVRSGRLVQLSLEYLSLEPIGREGRARVFKAVKRR